MISRIPIATCRRNCRDISPEHDTVHSFKALSMLYPEHGQETQPTREDACQGARRSAQGWRTGDRRFQARQALPSSPRDPRRGQGPGLAGGQHRHGRRATGRSAASSSRTSKQGRRGPATASGSWKGSAERLQAEFGKGYDRSNLRNMRAFFVTYPNRRRTASTNCPGPITGSCSASITPTPGRSTRPRRSTPGGPPANWSARSTRCSSSGWP